MKSIVSSPDARDSFSLMLLERIEALEDRANELEAELDKCAAKEIMTFVRYYAYRNLQAGATHYYAYLLEQLELWSQCHGFSPDASSERGGAYMLKHMRRDEWNLVPFELYSKIGAFLISMTREHKKAFSEAWLFQLIGGIADAQERREKYVEALLKAGIARL